MKADNQTKNSDKYTVLDFRIYSMTDPQELRVYSVWLLDLWVPEMGAWELNIIDPYIKSIIFLLLLDLIPHQG